MSKHLNKEPLHFMSLEEIHFKDEIDADMQGAKIAFDCAINFYQLTIARLHKREREFWDIMAKASGLESGRNCKLRMISIRNQMVIVSDEEYEDGDT